MKKILRYIIMLFITVCTFVACKKMDGTYKDFIVPGGLTYTSKPTAAAAYAGRHRIKIAWLRGSDPNVTKARIFWNNLADSVEINIPPTGDVISYIFNDLEEKSYTFVVKTYDDKGNASIPVELFGGSFGDKYQAEIQSLHRPIKFAELDADGKVTVEWGAANITSGAYATDIKYTDHAGKTQIKRFEAGETTSILPNYDGGSLYQYRTVYLPDSLSIDTFYTDFVEKGISAKIKKAGLLVTADSFAATSQLANGGGPPGFAFDDDVNTFWHTHHTPAPVPVFPHWLCVDLAKAYKITRVELFSRPGVTNGFAQFTLQGSMDGKVWTDYGSFNKEQKDPGESYMPEGGPATMRYLRLYITAPAVAGQAHTNLAEFSVFGYE